MAASKPFRIDTTVATQLLGDPEFYTRCIAYLFLREQGVATVAKYHEAVQRRHTNPDCCREQDDRRIVQGVVGAFTRHTVALASTSAEHLKPLREFVIAKLGYTPTQIIMYYMEGSKKQSITF